ncbi:glycosyltransferase family 4 protein [Patescibacteria group bacterium]|nr:glycosyltransferase family 4 protein [Patescibacteria group bacterium]
MKKKNINIGVIVPPFTTVPPSGQGGTERIAKEMIEGLTKKGYKVTLFGAGRYKGSAKFIQIFKKTITERKFDTAYSEASRPLRLESAYIARVMKEIIKREGEFNIIFNHARGGYLFLPLSLFIKTPIVSIFHLPIFKEAADVLASYKKPNVVTISNSQRKGFPNINYLATVYNGVNTKEFKFCEKPKDYFLYMGAMAEHKNTKAAILAAKRAKVKLILAGGKKREPYFSKEIKPLIDGKQIKYVGEVSGKRRTDLVKYAKGFLFPIKWPEPFGIVMIEAMASGVPVIAYPNGAVPEVVKDKKTGFIAKNIKEIVKAIKNIDKIDRKKCRARVKKYFTVEKMVDDYEKIIKRLI